MVAADALIAELRGAVADERVLSAVRSVPSVALSSRSSPTTFSIWSMRGFGVGDGLGAVDTVIARLNWRLAPLVELNLARR